MTVAVVAFLFDGAFATLSFTKECEKTSHTFRPGVIVERLSVGKASCRFLEVETWGEPCLGGGDAWACTTSLLDLCVPIFSFCEPSFSSATSQCCVWV